MKTIGKTSYIFLVCAFILSSCNREDSPVHIPDSSDNRIHFHTSLPTITTKAAEIVSDIEHFNITAFNVSDDALILTEEGKLKEYFDTTRIEKNTQTGKFISDLCTWPKPGHESDLLHFFAFYPDLGEGADVQNATSFDTNNGNKTVGYKLTGFSVAPDLTDQIDFIAAYANGTMDDNLFSGISLRFRHQLSRIEVKAKGSNKSCDIEIAGVHFCEVAMGGTFSFQTATEGNGVWETISKGEAGHIFTPGETIVRVGAEPISIMGDKIGEGNDIDNCAMLIPSDYTGWDYAGDPENSKTGLYISVLLRVLDKTPGGGGKQQYPYFDNSQGLNAMNIPRVYLAVDNSGRVTENPGTLYKGADGTYYTDKANTIPYSAPAGSEIKEFGWASLPISGNWEAGKIYTYTLDYSYGVGVHGPKVPGEVSPKAGDPIISDRVGVSLGFQIWTNGATTGITVPGN